MVQPLKWSDQDEAVYQSMLARRKAVTEQNIAAVEAIVEREYYRDIPVSELTTNLIGSADALVAALRPFLKEKKP